MKPIDRLGLAVIAIALWLSSGSVAEARKPIRIGASASQTGTYAALGQNQLRGYQLCFKHTNEKGGLLGRNIELVVEDDQSQPATAVSIYERLITQGKVDLVLGPYGSPMTEPVTNLTERHRMPMVAPTVGTTSIFKEGRKFIFQVYSPAEDCAGTSSASSTRMTRTASSAGSSSSSWKATSRNPPPRLPSTNGSSPGRRSTCSWGPTAPP